MIAYTQDVMLKSLWSWPVCPSLILPPQRHVTHCVRATDSTSEREPKVSAPLLLVTHTPLSQLS